MRPFSVTKPQQAARVCGHNYPLKDDEVSGHAFDIEKESKMRGCLKIMELKRTRSQIIA